VVRGGGGGGGNIIENKMRFFNFYTNFALNIFIVIPCNRTGYGGY
jgi:hypothetical protein